jgi:hypothetical protein
MKRNKYIRRDGYYIDPEIADGDSVKVPVMLCDGPPRKWKGWVSPLTDAEVKLLDQHRSGYRTLDQVSDRQAKAGAEIARDGARSARDAWLQQMSDAWKLDKRKPPPDDDDDDEDEVDDGNPRAIAIAARDRWVASLASAYRAPAPSPKLAYDLSTGPHGPFARDSAALRGAAGPGPARTLSPGGVPDNPGPPDKDAMYRQRCRDLENAWRSPAGPGPAVAGASVSWKGPGA